MTILKNVLKRLQNVKSPQKRQGPTSERGHFKKRQNDFSTSDKEVEDYDADSSGGSTIILSQISGGSSDDSLSSCKWKDNFVITMGMKVSSIHDMLHTLIFYIKSMISPLWIAE